jgi:hypothetical protein
LKELGIELRVNELLETVEEIFILKINSRIIRYPHSSMEVGIPV